MKKAKKPDSISTFLGPEAKIDGTIEFQGTIRLDGRVKGKIKSSGGSVIIGEKAVVDAEVTVSIAIIMGKVNGTIDATDRIEIYPPGRVSGDIQAPVISIDDGGVFNGNCTMVERPDSQKKKRRLLGRSVADDKPEKTDMPEKN